MPRRLMLEEFIDRANKIHKNKYSYSLAEYKNNSTKVKIICPIHDVFLQRPGDHLKGAGCDYCGGSYKKTTEKFIKEAKEVHGNKYDYSLVEYENCHKKVTIICNKCQNQFKQTPSQHLTGYNCIKCSRSYSPTTEEFIKKAINIHGNKYDYSLVDYKRNNVKIKIICNIHKEFLQLPKDHLKGFGCDQCSGGYKLTTKTFIEKAKKVHGEKYDYSLVNYKFATTKVSIICKYCNNIFTQMAYQHLYGQGCSWCSKYKNERFTRIFLKQILNETVEIVHHKKFLTANLIAKKYIYVDFYFELNNKKYIVEYNGDQHYRPVNFGGISNEKAIKNFFNQQIRDEFLRSYCKENNIVLIEIDGRKYTNNKIKDYLVEQFKLFGVLNE